MVYVAGFVATFIMVFLKGFQHQNVIGGNYKAAFFTSYGMATADVAVIGLVAINGWSMVVPTGAGASFGIVASMYIHRKYIKRENRKC